MGVAVGQGTAGGEMGGGGVDKSPVLLGMKTGTGVLELLSEEGDMGLINNPPRGILSIWARCDTEDAYDPSAKSDQPPPPPPPPGAGVGVTVGGSIGRSGSGVGGGGGGGMGDGSSSWVRLPDELILGLPGGVLAPGVVRYLVTGYVLWDLPAGEACAHNASVALSCGLVEEAYDWRFLGIVLSDWWKASQPFGQVEEEAQPEEHEG
ncbi:unnamed protein product, partial [Discosporangium mesarthrocarpum]